MLGMYRSWDIPLPKSVVEPHETCELIGALKWMSGGESDGPVDCFDD